jgi:hypothetical protein
MSSGIIRHCVEHGDYEAFGVVCPSCAGVAHPDGGAPPCEECGAAITGGALECPTCGYIQQGGAPPEPSEEAIAVARAILAKGRHPNWVPKALRAAYAVDFVRAASRPGHP